MRGILLDRDGVINAERADYVKSWDEFVFLPGALDALQRLAMLPYPIVVVTNQSVIGRGIVARSVIDEIHQRAQQTIHAAGGRIDGFFLCPHHPDEGCRCRKPQPGLLLQAAEVFGFSLDEAIFIGDAITDYLAAVAAGAHSILVQSGRQGSNLATLVAQHKVTLPDSVEGTATPNVAAPQIVADLAAATDALFKTMNLV